MPSSATGVGMPICLLGGVLLILTQKNSQKFGDVLGIFYKPLIIYGAEYHCTEIADKHHRRVYLQVLFGSEKSLVVRDKRQRQLFQSNILDMIMRLQELTDIGTSYPVSCE